jgi:hypothetical protein
MFKGSLHVFGEWRHAVLRHQSKLDSKLSAKAIYVREMRTIPTTNGQVTLQNTFLKKIQHNKHQNVGAQTVDFKMLK